MPSQSSTGTVSMVTDVCALYVPLDSCDLWRTTCRSLSFLSLYIHLYTHTHTLSLSRKHAHTYTHMHTLSLTHTHTHAHTRTYIHTHSLDPELKEQLVEVIEKLLKDQTTVSVSQRRIPPRLVARFYAITLPKGWYTVSLIVYYVVAKRCLCGKIGMGSVLL